MYLVVIFCSYGFIPFSPHPPSIKASQRTISAWLIRNASMSIPMFRKCSCSLRKARFFSVHVFLVVIRISPINTTNKFLA